MSLLCHPNRFLINSNVVIVSYFYAIYLSFIFLLTYVKVHVFVQEVHLLFWNRESDMYLWEKMQTIVTE